MANRDIKDVKRFVNNVSKEVGEKAYDPTEYATKEYVDETFEKKTDVVEVIANPELSGDEADLTGLEVGGVKYKAAQGGSVEYVELNSASGTLTDEQIIKILNDGFCKFLVDSNYMILSLCGDNGLTRYFSSSIDMDGKFYIMAVTGAPGGSPYTVTEVSVGGGSGTTSLGTTYAISKQIQGKHLDVDALLSLVNKYAPEGTQCMYIGLYSYEHDNLAGLIQITADGSSSGIYVVDNRLIDTDTYENDVAEFLTNNKIAIEEATINIQQIPDYAFLGVDVKGYAYDDTLETYSTATPEEILSLFVN